MTLRASTAGAAAVVVLLLSVPAHASTKASSFVRSLDEMMVALAPDSAHASATIRRAYAEHLELLALSGYTDLESALENGGIVPLPADARRFNLVPRLKGPNPIGEKDLRRQSSYVSARTATLGMLIAIASQVKSGPLEVTSLVRHTHYQDELKTTNANANTSVPMHTMGLAVDIGLVNSPLKTAYELRDVLRRMQRRGEILFIGERRQLVFHVVPHPSKLGHFADLYARKVGIPPTSRSAHVVADVPGPVLRKTKGAAQPSVSAEAVAFLPATAGPWPVAVEGAVAADEVVAAEIAAGAPSRVEQAAASAGRTLRGSLLLFAGVLVIGWRLRTPARLQERLFEMST